MSKMTILVGIVFLALFSAGGSFLYVSGLQNENFLTNLQTAFFGHQPEVGKYTKVNFVGDIMLGRHVETLLQDNGSTYPYQHLETSKEEVWVGNFESTVPDKHKQTEDFNIAFSVDEDHVDALYDFGFRYLSLANNHTYDFGKEVFAETQENLDDFALFGSPNKVTEESITYVHVNETIVALIGINATTNRPRDSLLRSLLHKVQTQSDVQLAYIHWGTEYIANHNQFQEDFATFLVENGVDAVIGHHPHVVQDVDLIDGVPVFYSLGNFVFDQYFSDEVQEGLLVSLEVNDQLLEFTLQPLTSVDTLSAPRYMTDQESAAFLQKLAKRSDVKLQTSLQNGKIVVLQ